MTNSAPLYWVMYVNNEEKVKTVLSDERLKRLKSALENEHSIDCLFLLLLEKGRWKNARDFLRSQNAWISDNTFRARMKDFEQMGYAESVPLGKSPVQKTWVITPSGRTLAKRLLGVLCKA